MIKKIRTSVYSVLIFGPSYYILVSMTIQQIYNLAIEMGMNADPRGVAGVKKDLKRLQKKYSELSTKKKEFFDKESLKNPYADTRLLFGDTDKKVTKVMAGIDTETAEVLLADRLNEKFLKNGSEKDLIDLVISHHPSGHALASLYEVMDLQVDVYAKYGVPVNVADALFRDRMGYVKRRFNPLNHNQSVDAARLLNIPLMVIHTVWDNMGDDFLRKYLDKKDFYSVGDVYEAINEIPEFREAKRGKSGPDIVSGSESSRAGKVVVNFTGGTNPSKALYQEMAKAGIGTLVEMHVAEEDLKELRKLHINVIDTGHMSADSIGANLFLDEIEKHGIEVIPCSGLIRVKRS